VSPRSDGPRILFYSHNGVGIGHASRQLTLAGAVRERYPGSNVLVVTGSHAAGVLPWPDGVEHLKLPSIRMVDRYRSWVPRNLTLPIKKVTKLRSGLIREAVRRFAPDLLVADFLPGGPYGELLPALAKLEQRGGRAVAGFRDIIDEPAFVRELWEENGTYSVVADRYAAVCVYGSPKVVDFEREYKLACPRVEYVGYLSPNGHPAEDGPPFVLATTGGGVDGHDLLHAFVEAVESLSARRLIVTGPLLPGKEYKELRGAATAAGVEIKRTVSDLPQLVQEASVVVTMAGYNTSCALLSGSARAVVAPRNGPSQEQRLRAGWLERWGIGEVVQPDAAADVLAAAIGRALATPPAPAPPVPLDGIERAVDLFAQVSAR
jgi:predicted glycosyltransferase